METLNNHFFTDMGVMLGRSMRHVFRGKIRIITAGIIIIPIAFMLLFVCLVGYAIRTLEEFLL